MLIRFSLRRVGDKYNPNGANVIAETKITTPLAVDRDASVLDLIRPYADALTTPGTWYAVPQYIDGCTRHPTAWIDDAEATLRANPITVAPAPAASA